MPLDRQLRKAQRVAAASLFIALAFAVATMIAVSVWIRYERLTSNQVLACYVTHQLDRAQVILPDISYYQIHTDELKEALADIERQRHEAAAAWGTCPVPTH